MRLAFVGGTRFIGHHAAIEALARGHQVTVLHRGRTACEVEGVEEVRVDRSDPGALATAIARARADVVIDTYAMTRADGQSIALAARIAATRLIVLSSIDVYAAFGVLLGHPAPAIAEQTITEASPLTPVTFPFAGKGHDGGEHYDKKHVEAEVANAGVPTCVLRLPAVYGLRDYRRRLGDIVDALDAGRPVRCAGGCGWRLTHAHVRDVAHAIVLVAEASRAGFAIYNLGEVATPTMGERAQELAAAIGVPVTFADDTERYPDLIIDSSRIRRELGFAEVTTEAARIADVIAAARATR